MEDASAWPAWTLYLLDTELTGRKGTLCQARTYLSIQSSYSPTTSQFVDISLFDKGDVTPKSNLSGIGRVETSTSNSAGGRCSSVSGVF